MSLFAFLGIFRPTLEFFTRTETSPLPLKSFKFWCILGTHGYRALRVLQNDKPIVSRITRLYGLFQELVTLTYVAKRFAVELLLPIFTLWAGHGWDWNTKPWACEANALTDWSTPAVFTTSFHLNNLKKSEFPTSRMLRVTFFWNENWVCGSR